MIYGSAQREYRSFSTVLFFIYEKSTLYSKYSSTWLSFVRFSPHFLQYQMNFIVKKSQIDVEGVDKPIRGCFSCTWTTYKGKRGYLFF